MRARNGLLLPLLLLGTGASALACNALTEIGDFTFDDTRDASANPPSSRDGAPETGGEAPGACGTIGSAVPDCQDCIEKTCCDEARACSDDAACVAHRDCLRVCRTRETERERGECVATCIERNACGLEPWRNFTICRDTKCRAACAAATAPVDAGRVEPGACVPPVTGPCNDVPQCGCGPGRNCIIETPGGRTACVAAGSTANNTLCGRNEDCRVGSSCVAGVCKASCHEVDDCGAASDGCFLYRSTIAQCGPTSLVPFNVRGFCNTRCDPENPSAVCGQLVTCDPRRYLDCRIATGLGTGPSCAQGCAPGYECFTYGSDDHGVCSKWCKYKPGLETCPGGFTCSRAEDPPEGYGRCTRNCSPLGDTEPGPGPRGCPPGSRCYAVNDAFDVGHTDCIPASGTKALGAACADVFECGPGTVCAENKCTPPCQVGGAPCPNGAACVGGVTVRGAMFGYCKPR